MDPERTTILFGPPGTGKTTSLVSIVQECLDRGIQANEIVFIAFTRKAANEARDRIMKVLNLPEDSIPWFRTLHSLAFELLGLERRNVMALGDYLKIADMLAITITLKHVNEDGTMMGMSKGDRLFFMENMARATRRKLREHWELFPNEDVYWYELERLAKTLEDYKKVHGKLDFTDMIARCLENNLSVGAARVVIVDEAQDLSPLQWDMVELLAKDVEEIYIAGDDDQAIFRWAGADVDRLIDMPGNRRVLTQSWRVPTLIQQEANTIAARILKRVKKVWQPRDAVGGIDYYTAIEQIDMSKGEWLLLARNAYLLEQYSAHCIREGFIFEGSSSMARSDAYKAIVAWKQLTTGNQITAEDCKTLYSMMSVRTGIRYGAKAHLDRVDDRAMLDIVKLKDEYGLMVNGPWEESLDRLTGAERQFYLAAQNRGEQLVGPPRIRISTIHSVKGGEASNVVVCPDMADRTWKEFQDNPDDEHRVWYVAITRARERLHILQPATNKAYEI